MKSYLMKIRKKIMISMEMKKGLQVLMAGALEVETMGIMEATHTSLVAVPTMVTSPPNLVVPTLSPSPLAVTLQPVEIHLTSALMTCSPISLELAQKVGPIMGVSAVHPGMILGPHLIEIFQMLTL